LEGKKTEELLHLHLHLLIVADVMRGMNDCGGGGTVCWIGLFHLAAV